MSSAETSHSCTILEAGLEENILLQLVLACLTVLAPHVCDNNNILEGSLSTQFSEHPEVLHRDPAQPVIGDPVEVGDTGEFDTPFVPACLRDIFASELCIFGNKSCSAHDLARKSATLFSTSVALRGIVESRCVNQNEATSV